MENNRSPMPEVTGANNIEMLDLNDIEQPTPTILVDHAAEENELEAAIYEAGPARRLWEQIYSINDDLSLQGNGTVSSHLANSSPVSDVDRSIHSLFRQLSQEAKRRVDDLQRTLPRMQEHLHDPAGLEYRTVTILSYQAQVAQLRIQPEFFGDRAAIAREASISGFAAMVHDLIDNIEQLIGEAQEKFEEIFTQYQASRCDVLARLEAGEFYHDPLVGYVDYDHVNRNKTGITGFSVPVRSHCELGNNVMCPICLLEYPTDSLTDIVRTTCNHILHGYCLGMWVNTIAGPTNNTHCCPECRTVLFVRTPYGPGPRLQRYYDVTEAYDFMRSHIEWLRFDVKNLVEILEEVQPDIVARSLGR